MSISFVSAGTWSASSLTDGIQPGMPSGVGAGDIMLLCVLGRSDPTGATPTISGWTLVDSEVVTVGSEGGDRGSVVSIVYKREWQSGDTAPTLDAVTNGWDTGAAIIFAYSKTSGTWETASAVGTDSTIDTSHSAAATSDPGGTTDDVLFAATAVNGNIAGITISSEAASWSGATLGTLTRRFIDDSSSGRDMIHAVHDVPVSSGTSSGNPSITWTWPSSGPNSPASAVVYVRLRAASGGGAQSITGAGAIASTEAFGTPAVTPGAVSVSPTGIATSEAFGTASVTTGAVTVTTVGIGSAEAFGTPTVTPGAATISPTGIASEEAFGTSTVTTGAVTVSPTSIASEEAFGTPVISQGGVTLSPSSIASEEAFGTPAISPGPVTVSPTGIASEEAFGTPTVSQPSGSQTVSPTSIASEEAFGTPTVSPGPVTVSPSGIGTSEAFGSPSIALQVRPEGIQSSEEFGVPQVSPGPVSVAPEGVLSAEAFGTPTLSPGPISVLVAGIASSEVFGTPVLTRGEPAGVGSVIMEPSSASLISTEDAPALVTIENQTPGVTTTTAQPTIIGG